MARLTFEEIEELATIQSQLCVSIFIPTHRYGHEVNDSQDIIAFKNELQKVKNKLLDQGYQDRFVNQFLKPAQELQEDKFQWSHMEEGLAVFIAEDYFKYCSYPVSFNAESIIAKDFMLSPVLSLLNGNGKFYILNIDQEEIKLYQGDKFDIEEVKVPDDQIPSKAEDVLHYYEFKSNLHRRNSAAGSGNFGANFHGHDADDEQQYKYISQFYQKVDSGLTKFLSNQRTPVILAGTDNMQALYRKHNHYNTLMDQGIKGNHERTHKKDLHQKAWEIVKDHFEQPIKKQCEKYEVLGGTGKTSYDLNNIFQSAIAGRVETVFYNKDKRIWGDISQEGELDLHKDQQENDVDVLNSIAIQTILNSGQAVPVSKEELPEKEADVDVAAIFRY